MISRHYIRKSLILAIAGASLAVAAQNVNLPTIKIQGVEYYYYKVKKGDSPYGLCKRYGWNEDTLTRCNANFATKITKGQTIYYPVVTGKPAEKPVVGSIDKVRVAPEPIVHKVARGESVYSISKLYNVPVDVIYANNPDARHGVKAGETLTIVQPVFENATGSSPFYYTVRKGETLTAIAQNFNTDVASIMRENPGMSERTLKAGENIRIIPNNRSVERVVQTHQVEQVTGFSQYKVDKNDSWDSIASQAGISTEQLKSANASDRLKKGEWIAVPQISEVTTEAIVERPVKPEATISDRDKIYNDVHHVGQVAEKRVDVTVVLDKPSAKSNIDFMRGFLMGVDDQKNSGAKINLNVVDASKGIAHAGADSLLNASNLIIGVYDNDFPSYLADFGKKNGVEVVNVLDTKSDLYENNSQMVQLLQPINYFNDMCVSYIVDKNPGAQLILLGENDSSDKFAETLSASFSPDVTTRLSLEEFQVYPFNPEAKYVVYCYTLKKDEIAENLKAIIDQQDKGVAIVPVGRAQWIAYAQPLAEQYGASQVLVPSRVYVNAFDQKQKDFNSRFHQVYHRNPVNSFPQYAMLGYDVAGYFIPTTAGNGGDYNTGITHRPGLQNDINVKRLNNWSGFINTNGYILHYLPAELVERIEIQ